MTVWDDSFNFRKKPLAVRVL